MVNKDEHLHINDYYVIIPHIQLWDFKFVFFPIKFLRDENFLGENLVLLIIFTFFSFPVLHFDDDMLFYFFASTLLKSFFFGNE